MDNITDKFVIRYCNNNRYKNWKNRDIQIVNYLLNRFDDFTVNDIYDKCRESLYRLKHNIDSSPLCPICNNLINYNVGFKFYPVGCSKKCIDKIALNKRKITSLNKYGVEFPSKSQDVKEKQKQTNLEKYGTVSALQNEIVKSKTKATLINKYGVENIAQSEYWKNNVNKTCLQKYGTLYANQSEIVKNKIKETTYLHYGVDNYWKTIENKNKANSIESIQKGINTKKQKGNLNTSKPEQESYRLLLEKFPDVKKEFKEERYPFNCDFYIPNLDLFIECNFHWTHGGHPYNEETDKKQLELWKSKDSQFYKNAINTWTIRDVNKREIAKKNNLNWIEFFTLNELKEWLETYENSK